MKTSVISNRVAGGSWEGMNECSQDLLIVGKLFFEAREFQKPHQVGFRQAMTQGWGVVHKIGHAYKLRLILNTSNGSLIWF